MSIRGLLDLAFCIDAVEDVLNLDLLPGVQVHKVQSPPSSGIRVSLFQFFMSKSNVISLVPIVFIEQGKTPVTIIDFSSLPIAAEIDLSSEGDSALWSRSKPALTLCILTMPYMCHDLKEILWVPNFYYICQICYLRLGVRSSGFTHD